MGERAADELTSSVVAGGTWLFMSSLVVSLAGFVMWIIITRVLGVTLVGSASALTSAAGMSVAFISSGLPIAVIREFAAYGRGALRPTLLVSAVLAAAAGGLAYALAARIPHSFGIPTWSAVPLATLSVLSIVFLRGLVGIGLFKRFFKVILTSSVIKVLVAVVCALTGYGVLAPILGYVAFPLVGALVGSFALLSFLGTGDVCERVTVGEVVRAAYSNYPFAFSNQVLVMLSVYFFATLVGKAFGTGVLYLSFMIVSVVMSICASVLTASLSIGLRLGTNPFTQALRAGLALTMPLATALAVAPALTLRLINPALAPGSQVLSILALSVAPASVVAAYIMRMNREKAYGRVAVVGVVRLAVLAVLIPVLAGVAGASGVALAFLLANIASLAVVLPRFGEAVPQLVVLWLTQSVALLASSLLGVGPYSSLARLALTFSLGFLITLAVGHVTGVAKLGSILSTIKSALRSVFA